MRIPSIPFSWLTKAQMGCAVAGVCITTAWLCVNECSDKTLERILIVGGVVSAIAQTYLTSFQQEPVADLCESEERQNQQSSWEESWVWPQFELCHWEEITGGSQLPSLDISRIALTTTLALVGPVLGTISTVKEWCVVDPDLDSKAAWLQIGIKVAVALSLAGGVIKVYRARRVQSFVCQKEVELLGLPPTPDPEKRQFVGRMYRHLAARTNHRLEVIETCLRAWRPI